MHESLDEFKFRLDITDSRVICSNRALIRASEKLMNNVVNTLAPSLLIRSSSFLQVTRTSVTSSKLDQIRPRTVELAALEHLEKSS